MIESAEMNFQLFTSANANFIGSDFDGVDGDLPPELKTAADFPHLVAGLQQRGYSDADIRKLLGGNLLRAWTAIEAGAAK